MALTPLRSQPVLRTPPASLRAVQVTDLSTNLMPPISDPIPVSNPENNRAQYGGWHVGASGAPTMSIVNGAMRLEGTKAALGDLRPITPEFSINKHRGYFVRYKVNNIQTVAGNTGSLWIRGSVSDNTPYTEFGFDSNGTRSIDARTKTVLLPDGFALREYYIPPGTLSGSGTMGRFALFYDWSNSGIQIIEVKDFDVYMETRPKTSLR